MSSSKWIDAINSAETGRVFTAHAGVMFRLLRVLAASRRFLPVVPRKIRRIMPRNGVALDLIGTGSSAAVGERMAMVSDRSALQRRHELSMRIFAEGGVDFPQIVRKAHPFRRAITLGLGRKVMKASAAENGFLVRSKVADSVVTKETPMARLPGGTRSGLIQSNAVLLQLAGRGHLVGVRSGGQQHAPGKKFGLGKTLLQSLQRGLHTRYMTVGLPKMRMAPGAGISSSSLSHLSSNQDEPMFRSEVKLKREVGITPDARSLLYRGNYNKMVHEIEGGPGVRRELALRRSSSHGYDEWAYPQLPGYSVGV